MRRKKYTKKRRSSRRRIGAIGKTDFTSIIGVVAGAAAGSLVAQKLLPTMDERIKNAGVIAIGALLMPRVIKGSLGAGLGYGMIASGGIGLLKNFNVISGMEDTLEIPVAISGDDELSVISGDDEVLTGDDLSVISGDDESYY
jgi:hypothetical protein